MQTAAVDPRARRVALNVSGAALVLAAAKAAVGFGAGSIALLSSALDSAGDCLASFANYIFLTIAAKPPDSGHQFGHGKAENLASMLQGVLLLGGAIGIGLRAFRRIHEPQPIDASYLAIAAMLVSIVVTVAITLYLRRNAALAGSSALASDALHYTSDFVANGATILALVLVRFTADPLYDSILGIIVAAWIAWSAAYLLWNAGGALMDPALPEDEIGHIIEVIDKADPIIVGYRDLRTRRAAGIRFIDFELCIDREVSFDTAHEIAERVKARIRERFPQSIINVHAEPVARGAETETP